MLNLLKNGPFSIEENLFNILLEKELKIEKYEIQEFNENECENFLFLGWRYGTLNLLERNISRGKRLTERNHSSFQNKNYSKTCPEIVDLLIENYSKTNSFFIIMEPFWDERLMRNFSDKFFQIYKKLLSRLSEEKLTMETRINLKLMEISSLWQRNEIISYFNKVKKRHSVSLNQNYEKKEILLKSSKIAITEKSYTKAFSLLLEARTFLEPKRFNDNLITIQLILMTLILSGNLENFKLEFTHEFLNDFELNFLKFLAHSIRSKNLNNLYLVICNRKFEFLTESMHICLLDFLFYSFNNRTNLIKKLYQRISVANLSKISGVPKILFPIEKNLKQLVSPYSGKNQLGYEDLIFGRNSRLFKIKKLILKNILRLNSLVVLSKKLIY